MCPPEQSQAAPPRFAVGDLVFDRARRFGLGRVQDQPRLDGGDWWYEVSFEGGREEVLAEYQLEPKTESDESLTKLARAGRFGTLQAFLRALAVERIRKESASRTTVYSFNAQRILFQAHQYKPLLKFLDSEDRRLLIADEVGLGKTIEAGLILTELEARGSPQRVLVVCPSRLTEKWTEELNRKFDQDFEVWKRDNVARYHRLVEHNPARSRMRAIVSLESIRREELRRSMLDAVNGHIDLLIVDEAHHARNKGTETNAALDELAAAASAVLLLTATPIHLGSGDLFNQLQILRPREFTQPEVFDRALRRNEGVLSALARIRTRRPAEMEQAARDIEGAFRESLFQYDVPELVAEMVRRLRGPTPSSAREWIELEHDAEQLHFLSHVITRTRKRDVHEFRAQRKARIEQVEWSDDEWRLFRAATGGVNARGWPTHPLGFAEIQRHRMAASSLFALIEYRDTDLVEETASQLFDVDDEDVPDGSHSANTLPPPSSLVSTTKDSKFERLLELLREMWSTDPDAKVLVFTYFVATSKYLERRLNDAGWKTLRIAGDVPTHTVSREKDERGRRVKQFKSDPAVRIMVSTEVGSEGLDFQFCRVVVNYDLPWNPMVVEQRIGRIDRFGQKADQLWILSLVVAGTVEERILRRLYERIGIFERSIGPLETILGDEIGRLRRDFFSGTFSPDQLDERVRQTEEAIERKRKWIEELDRQADRLFGHEDLIRAEMERIRRLGRYVTPEALLTVIQGYLERFHPSVRLLEEGTGLYSIRAPDSLLQDVRLRVGGTTDPVTAMKRFIRDGRYRFAIQGSVAYENEEYDLMNASHPFVRASLKALEDLLENPANRVGCGVLRLQGEEASEVPAGRYFVAVFRLQVTGVRDRVLLEAVAWSHEQSGVIDSEAAERLLYLLSVRGAEWHKPIPPAVIGDDAWNATMSEIRRRAKRLEERETRENELLYQRREARIRGEYDRQVEIVDARSRTSEMQGRDMARLQPMLDGQRQRAAARRDQELASLEHGRHVQASISKEPLAFCALEVTDG